MALPHPAMRCTDRLLEIINPAACAIARSQAPGDLELTPRTFGTGKRREALHSSIHRKRVPLSRLFRIAKELREVDNLSGVNGERTSRQTVVDFDSRASPGLQDARKRLAAGPVPAWCIRES